MVLKGFQRNPDSRNWFSKDFALILQISFLVKVNCECPSNCDIFYSVGLQYEAHRKLFAVLTFRAFQNAWIKAKHQMRCRIWQKSKSVIWITVSFANWSINKLPISDLIYKLFSRGRGLSKIFGTTNNFGVNTWRVLFPWHLPGSDTFTFTGSDTFLAHYRTFNLWL